MDKCNDIVEKDKLVYSSAGRMPYYPLVIAKGQGALVEDVDGNQYIDMLASAAALNTGHAHPHIVAEITQQAQKFIHYTPAYMFHEPLVELAQELIDITPGSFEKRVVFGLSGSDAIDGMIKHARAYTGRSIIISFVGAYHGATYGSLSLSAISLNMRRKIGPIVPDMHHINYPNCYRCKYNLDNTTCDLECFKELEEALSNYIPIDNVAAILIEPIAGDSGVNEPPQRYLDKLYNLCKENGVLFAVDEIQQGFGRTGKWFSIEHFGIEPDIIVMGKAIASGMPMSAIVAREEIMHSLEAPAHLFTTMGNPVCCKAALATINVIKNEELIKQAEELGAYMKKRFEQMREKYEIIGDVRGKGMSVGVDLVKNRNTKEPNKEAAAKICYRSWEKGVIIAFIAGGVLRIQPPLVITKEQIDTALDGIEASIQEYIAGSIPDDVLNVAKGWTN
ncbi:aspartate aminotransferase family protein [Desulfuribacillus alkaliarsenatis]|uniref:(S)-3-amino-2-methylpropionate transaminase n=1 Tax=Desulfuribacillus alkaliarsenatis TaxID=766136 RepID=A0A1E5G3F1_9FIRM|nr:4-aminobutyrate aminotransferase [Desulfuribacillus alkaliarsenatis]